MIFFGIYCQLHFQCDRRGSWKEMGGGVKKSQLIDKINNILCFVDVIVVDKDFSIFPSVNFFFFFACSFFSNAHYELKSLTEAFCTHLPSPDKMLSLFVGKQKTQCLLT